MKPSAGLWIQSPLTRYPYIEDIEANENENRDTG